MMTVPMTEDGEGVRAARARTRRRCRIAVLSLLGALAVSLVMLLGKTGPGHLQPGYAVAAVIAMAVVLPLAIYFNNQAKDELARLNALRANSFGLYAFLLGGWSWLVLSNGGLVPQPNVLFLILATSMLTLGRYAMLRIRG